MRTYRRAHASCVSATAKFTPTGVLSVHKRVVVHDGLIKTLRRACASQMLTRATAEFVVLSNKTKIRPTESLKKLKVNSFGTLRYKNIPP